MGIRLVTFYNSTVTPQDDALIYENSLPASGMIYGGNVTIKNANTLHITAGHGALCGRKFTIEEDDIPIILTSSGTLNGRLYIHMDLSDTGEPISLEVERANSLTPVVQQPNVNITDGIYEINLATFTISTSTVSDLKYVAPFIKDLDLREVIIAPVEPSNVASSNYAVGKHLILDKVLYVVTTTITAGQTITPGSNVAVSDTVEKQIEDINTALDTKVNTADIANNLTTTAAGKVLDARQGKALNDVLVPKANQAVIATRQTNLTASRAYKVGDQFIYNNTLYRATAAISSGGTINIGSGGNATTADDVTTQISNLANQDYKFGTSISLSPYTSSGNAFTAPSDGYVRFSNATSNDGYVDIQAIGFGALIFDYAARFGPYTIRTVFVRKGMKIYINHCDFNNSWYCVFMPIIPVDN